MKTKPFSDLSEELKSRIVAHIEANQPKIYWDRGDELSKEDIDLVFSSEDGINDVEEKLWDWNHDASYELELQCLEETLIEFKDELTAELGWNQNEDEDEAPEWEEEYKDYLRDYISVDMNIRGLIDNTRDSVFFYDTCEEFGGQCFNSPMERYNDIRRIKKTLGIKTKAFDRDVKELLDNASYGGQLVVYFQAGVGNLRERMNKATEKSIITFKGCVSIAITNTGNGSGHSVEIKHEFELPFAPENLFFEDIIKYNYSWAVCGMCHDWCSGTDWGFKEKTRKQRVAKSSLNASIDKDREYKRIYQAGGCTFGDMDIRRHRNTPYSNDYPCGNRCTECGTFWVD